MRGLLTAIVFGAAGLSVGPAVACSTTDSFTVFFATGSAEISPQAMNTIRQAVGRARAKIEQKLPEVCQQFVVTGYTDMAEATTPDVRVDIARAEAVGRKLDQLGIGADAIRTEGQMGKLLVQTGPGVREPQNRRAELHWTVPQGRWRCDPTTEQEPFAPGCVGKYRACYYELTDGTVCNFESVPDPSPQRYSVFYP